MNVAKVGIKQESFGLQFYSYLKSVVYYIKVKSSNISDSLLQITFCGLLSIPNYPRERLLGGKSGSMKR